MLSTKIPESSIFFRIISHSAFEVFVLITPSLETESSSASKPFFLVWDKADSIDSLFERPFSKER